VYGGGAAVTETADPESAGSWYGDYGDAAAATENADSKSAGAAQGCKKGVAGLQSIPEMSESRDGGGRRGGGGSGVSHARREKHVQTGDAAEQPEGFGSVFLSSSGQQQQQQARQEEEGSARGGGGGVGVVSTCGRQGVGVGCVGATVTFSTGVHGCNTNSVGGSDQRLELARLGSGAVHGSVDRADSSEPSPPPSTTCQESSRAASLARLIHKYEQPVLRFSLWDRDGGLHTDR